MSITQPIPTTETPARVKTGLGVFAQRSKSAGKGKSKSARNHRSKGTLFLSEAQANNAIMGAGFAEKIDRLLNHAIAIHFHKGGMTRRAQEFVVHYLRLASQWMADRGTTLTYLWHLEHSVNDKDKGLHVHILLHVPRALGDDFRQRAREQWAVKAGVTKLVRGVVDIQPIGGRRQRYYDKEHNENEDHRARYCRSLKGAMRYLLKGLDPSGPGQIKSLPEILGISTKPNEMIYGKRMGLSENIGARARLRRAQSAAVLKPADTG
jgi:hypothetical protein